LSKFTEGERRHLKTLIRDAQLYGLSEAESLQYVQQRLGRPVGKSHYYAIKARLESDEECRKWFNDFCRVGFVVEHRKRIEEMERCQAILFSLLLNEVEKPDSAPKSEPRRDKHLMTQIVAEIRANNKRLAALQNGSPVIAQTKSMLESGTAASATTTTTVEVSNEAVKERAFQNALEKAKEWQAKVDAAKKEKEEKDNSNGGSSISNRA
jgi:hypothetical protein